MLIDNDYLSERYNYFLLKKKESLQKSKTTEDRLYKIKLRFPKWLRTVVFHPFNPFYSIFVQYKSHKRKPKGYFSLQQLQPCAVDFVQYCISNKVAFDTDLYYPSTDEKEIRSFIDNRLMSCIPGYTQLPYTHKQLDMLEKRKLLSKKVRKEHNGFSLFMDEKRYFLPINSFDEPTYIHGYGLEHLSGKIKEYISQKDFLDIGAYLGDTSIFLSQNYDPKHIFAYEPVDTSAELVKKTIENNETNKISVIVKGLGEKDETVDIYVDPAQLSGSSINSSFAGDKQQKKQIHITTIDKECADRKIGLIKMDIEGAEYYAIKGGLETIKRDKPVLLISLYHTGKDFFEIPPLIRENVPDYQFRFLNIEIVNPFSEKILVGYPQGLC